MRRWSITFSLLFFCGAVCSASRVLAMPPASTEPPPAASPGPALYTPRGIDALTRAAIEKQRLRLTATIRPALRPKIAAAARLLVQRMGEPPPEGTKPLDAYQHAKKIVTDAASFNTTGYVASDIEALVHVVLLEAAKNAEDDLRNQTAAVEAWNLAKQCLHEAKNDKSKAKKCIAALQPTATMTKAQLDAFRDRIDGGLDSLSEMGETESMRLQMAMDRMSKLMSTLSNILKKISDTSSTITQNLK